MKEPSISTVKRLFALSDNKCAFPGCVSSLVEPTGVVTGRICHIRGRKSGSPRYDVRQTDEERHAFANLLLLCGRHHDIIDQQTTEYTVAVLEGMKASHARLGRMEVAVSDADIARVLLEKYREVNIIVESGAHASVRLEQPAGDIHFHTHAPAKVTFAPAAGAIGNNLLLKNRITELFNRLGEEREKRFGKTAYPVMYRNFKLEFEIGDHPWTVVWSWPESVAGPVIDYIEGKYGETIAGKRERAAKKGSALPTRPRLYQREKELLSQIGLSTSSPEVDDALRKYFGVTSHTDLTHHQHWLWVCQLEQQVREAIGETAKQPPPAARP